MPAKLERCVRHVKAKGGAANPYAVCNAALRKGKGKHGGGSTRRAPAASRRRRQGRSGRAFPGHR